MPADLYLGLDLGTSGARAVVIDASGGTLASGKAAMADFGKNHRDPATWWKAARTALEAALARIDRASIRALAVDGTSGTMLAVDRAGEPLGDALMYNDASPDEAAVVAIGKAEPATTRSCGERPNAFAASGVTGPIAAPGSTTSGRSAVSKPRRPIQSGQRAATGS